MNTTLKFPTKKGIKASLLILAILACLLGVVLFLQSLKFASSLWVLLQVGYELWEKPLLRMLEGLGIWSIVAGIIFSLQFLVLAPDNHLKRALFGMTIGFLVGVAFTFLFAFVLGITIFIPLGIISIFVPEIIKFALLEFGWLVAAYIVSILIMTETPPLFFYVIKNGNWYFRFLGILVAAFLGLQVVKTGLSGLAIILEHSSWRTDTFLAAMGTSLLLTILINFVLLRNQAFPTLILTILLVFIASMIAGNIAYGALLWGDTLSFIVASLLGPITFSLLGKTIRNSFVFPVLKPFPRTPGS